MVQRLAGYWRNPGHSFPVEPAKPVHIMAIFTINDFIVYHYNYRPTEYQSLSFPKQVKCDTEPTKETARKLFIQSAIEYPH